MAEKRLILASGSPRRSELLSKMGYTFETCAQDVDEHISGVPSEIVRTLAVRKARAAAAHYAEGVIIASDTLVSLDSKPLGKPADAEDAKRMLRALSNREHEVFTGVCVLDTETGREEVRVERTGTQPERVGREAAEDALAQGAAGILPAHAVSHMAESMPGMGIVACVLGVVLAMGKINEPPEILGHYIAAALVGTFFGILCCYGLFGPMGSKLENYVAEEHFYYHSVKEAVAAAIRGSTPLIAVEYGRRAIPYPFRPAFAEMEERLKSG